MKYIKDCPECGKKIRFPLDRGRIRIHCRCGYTAVIDPDDTSLYNDGKFDLSEGENPTSKKAPDFSSIRSKLDRKKIINSLLEMKYKIQNLRYMPDRERNRFLAVSLFLLLLVLTVIYFL